MSLRYYITEPFTLNAFVCTRLFQPGQRPINRPPSRFSPDLPVYRRSEIWKKAGTSFVSSLTGTSIKAWRSGGGFAASFFLKKSNGRESLSVNQQQQNRSNGMMCRGISGALCCSHTHTRAYVHLNIAAGARSCKRRM